MHIDLTNMGSFAMERWDATGKSNKEAEAIEGCFKIHEISGELFRKLINHWVDEED